MAKTTTKKPKAEKVKGERKRVDYVAIARYLIQTNFDIDPSWIEAKELPDVSRGSPDNAGVKATAAVWEKLQNLLSINEEVLPRFNELKDRYATGRRGPRIDAGELLKGNVVRYYNVLTNPKTGASFVRIPYVAEWYAGASAENLRVKVQWLEREIIITRAPVES